MTVAVLIGPGTRSVSETGAAEVARLSAVAEASAVAELAEPSAGAEAVPVRPGTAPELAQRRAPVQLRADAIDLSVPVRAVGVDSETGELAVPPAEIAGWYRYGPGMEATAGSLVIAAHVDSAAGPGAFFRVAELGPGDQLTLTDEAGHARTFEVVGREVYRKRDLPVDRYFARDGAPRLTLITCGGRFDRAAGEYRDNVVVTAVPR